MVPHEARISILVRSSCKHRAGTWRHRWMDNGQDMDCSLRMHANASKIYLLPPSINTNGSDVLYSYLFTIF
jgi:hypothetical protein